MVLDSARTGVGSGKPRFEALEAKLTVSQRLGLCADAAARCAAEGPARPRRSRRRADEREDASAALRERRRAVVTHRRDRYLTAGDTKSKEAKKLRCRSP